METARTNIREALSTAQSPAVLSSFGKDSLLLLALVREFNHNIPVLWLRTAATPAQQKFARRIIREWRLDVYSFLPNAMYVLTDSDHSAMVQEYNFNGESLPVIIDVKESPTDHFIPPTQRTEKLFLPFDLLLTGYKDTDDHWLKGDTNLFPPDYKLGLTKVRAPLRHLTDSQVREAIFNLNIPYEECDDQISLCPRCMSDMGTDTTYCPVRGTLIPTEVWEREQLLRNFRARFLQPSY